MRIKRVTTAVIARKESLHEYRKRNLAFWGLFLGFVPAVALIATPLGRLFNSNQVAGAVIALWFIAVFVAGIWWHNWDCPRCNKKFYYKSWYKNSFAIKCVNCGYRPAG